MCSVVDDSELCNQTLDKSLGRFENGEVSTRATGAVRFGGVMLGRLRHQRGYDLPRE